MESQESHQITATLARCVERGANAGQIADTIVATWQGIDAALTPVLGQQGVAALYKRSLRLTGPAYSWLAGMHESVPPIIDLPALKAVLSQRSSADAAAGGGALLRTFYDLLASLVGSSLTERLLRSVWANALSGPSAQDKSP